MRASRDAAPSIEPRRPAGGYLSFYWPLAMTSLLTQIESLCQNRTLATHGDVELSVYANAHSSFMMLNAFLAFIPQLVTMYARNPADRRLCFRFVCACGLGMALPLALIAYSPLGPSVLTHVQGVHPALLERVRQYLAWLAPVIFFVTMQQYITGRLVQAGRTRAIIRFNLLHLIVVVAGLEGLFRTGLDVRWVMASATFAANTVHVIAAGWYCRRLSRGEAEASAAVDAPMAADGEASVAVDAETEDEGVDLAVAATPRNEPGTMLSAANRAAEASSARASPASASGARVRTPAATLRAAAPSTTYRALWAFYWPMAMTGLMFALSRPIIYYFVNRLPDEATVISTLAALRVAFDTGMFFQAPVNQFRHVYAQFGAGDPVGVRRFMLATTGVYVGMMALVALTPLGDGLFTGYLKIAPESLAAVRETFLVMCFGPMMIAIRNVFHGELIIRRNTRGMAGGGLFRIGAVALLSFTCYRMGWLNHVTGAAIMVAGFAFEAFGAYRAARALALRAVPRG